MYGVRCHVDTALGCSAGTNQLRVFLYSGDKHLAAQSSEAEHRVENTISLVIRVEFGRGVPFAAAAGSVSPNSSCYATDGKCGSNEGPLGRNGAGSRREQ